MAAPRKYSSAQRQELFRLYEAGNSPAEIARLCKDGTAGVSPFHIPRRTVHDIVTAMAREAERDLPTTIDDEGILEAIGRFPERIARMVNDELDRLEARQKRSGLKPEDFTRLRAAHDLSTALSKRVNRPPTGAPRGNGKAGRQKRPESALERLAREEGERPGEKDKLSCTRTPPPPVKSTPTEPNVCTTPDPPPQTPRGARAEAAVRRVAAEHGIDIGELEEELPVDRSREAAALRVRAALAGPAA